jgi:DNA polymerase III subunit epsilon
MNAAAALLERLAAVTFIVIDFEALTPPGRPAEPIEVAAITMTSAGGGELTEHHRFEELIRPPAGIPVSPTDTRITGITAPMLAAARPAADVLADLDAQLTAPASRLIAHHAPTEAGLIGRQRDHCPKLAATPLIDTVRLARAAVPYLSSYRLDALLRHYGIPRPAARHRAMPDTEVTAEVFRRLLADGAEQKGWATLTDLDAAGGLQPARERPAGQIQQTLF